MKKIRCKNIFPYVLLSLAFMIVNLITLRHLAPWVDEVMMLDTAYNAAFHGSWETTAWYRVVGQYPFSTYPPLYQMIAAVWMRLFGGSLVVVRSLNLVIAFMLGGACLRFMKHHGIELTLWTTALFTMLFWGTSEMAWMYRNGRPDMLGALVVCLTVLAIDHYLRAKSFYASIFIVASSAFLFCSGIQAAVYLCALWLFSFIVMKSRRKELIALLPFLLAGFMLGLLLVSLFMQLNGRLVAFVCSIVQYSSTLSDVALTVLPWAGELFDIDISPYTQKLSELATDRSLGQRLASMAEYRSFLILSVIAFTAYVTSFRHNLRRLLCDEGFLLLLCALYVPLFMNLAGRFASYYRWMTFLPLLLSVMSIACQRRLWCTLFGLVAVVMSVFCIRSMLPDEHWNYENIRSFVQRQPFKSSDVLICPFSLFYEVKLVCDTCYFVGIFPTEYINHIDYIIEAPDGDGFDQRITDYVNNLKADATSVLTVIDHCDHPSLTLYKVQTRNE